MFQITDTKFCLAATCVVLGGGFLWKVLHKVTKNEELHQVLFFPLPKLNGRGNSGSDIKVRDSFWKLKTVIFGCERSLDMCLFLMTLPDVASLVIKLMKKGVRVRVIIDHNNIGVPGCQIRKMHQAGVLIVSIQQIGLMHHKFVLVDDRVLLTGSFNWTSQAVHYNNENIIVSSNNNLVKPFKMEFDKLWVQGKGISFNTPTISKCGYGCYCNKCFN